MILDDDGKKEHEENEARLKITAVKNALIKPFTLKPREGDGRKLLADAH